MKPSRKWRLNIWDFIKGLILSVAASSVGVVTESLQAGSLDINVDHVKLIAISTGVAYIGKKLSDGKTNSNELTDN